MVAVTIIVGILIISLLIFVHELGHYLVGRATGLKILEFSIGMGPKIIKWEKNSILYSIRAFPIGGMVVFHGEDDDIPDESAFNNQPKIKRFLTLIAGAVFNIVFAIIISAVILMGFGATAPVINETVENSNAQIAGLIPGDRILRIDGKNADFAMEAIDYLSNAKGSSVVLEIERDGQILEKNVNRDTQGKIGIVMGGIEKFGFFESFALSFKWVFYMIKQMLAFIIGLIAGTQSTSNLAGVVGMVDMVGKSLNLGFGTFLNLVALISINLGVLNLLPLPALDGGRVLLLFIEWIRGKPFPREKEGMVHFAGLVLFFGLIIIVTYNDIARLVSGG